VIHLLKLAVGIRDAAHLGDVQRGRAEALPPLRHRTRNAPRRAAELCDGGSIYWVIGGLIQIRQNVTDVIPDQWEDGSPCAGLILDPLLVRVCPRPLKAFQGWRYLAADDAPPDLTETPPEIAESLPPELLHALRALALM
jgi:hypothetical protein